MPAGDSAASPTQHENAAASVGEITAGLKRNGLWGSGLVSKRVAIDAAGMPAPATERVDGVGSTSDRRTKLEQQVAQLSDQEQTLQQEEHTAGVQPCPYVSCGWCPSLSKVQSWNWQ